MIGNYLWMCFRFKALRCHLSRVTSLRRWCQHKTQGQDHSCLRWIFLSIQAVLRNSLTNFHVEWSMFKKWHYSTLLTNFTSTHIVLFSQPHSSFKGYEKPNNINYSPVMCKAMPSSVLLWLESSSLRTLFRLSLSVVSVRVQVQGTGQRR